MTPISSIARLAGLLTAFVLTAALWSSTAGAQTQHPLSGNMRFQIGNGLPIPITLGPAPNGPMLAVPGAVVTTTGTATVKLAPSQFTNAGTPMNQPVAFANSAVFQVNTAIPIQFPRAASGTIAFVPSGRTGPNLVTFCPGQTATVVGGANPGCANVAAGTPIPGLMRYTRTAGEIGGPARASLGGTANVALVASPVSGMAPCTAGAGGSNNPACLAIFALATPAGTGAQGGAFGVVVSTAGGTPSPGLFFATVGPIGTVLNVQTGLPLGPGLPNPATSYGGPWTAGKLTVSMTGVNTGTPTSEVFVLSGSDMRAPGTGQGSVSLVSGSVSARTLSGPNSNRGWINMAIAPPFGVVPAMTTPGLAAAIGLIALAGAYFVRKRLS